MKSMLKFRDGRFALINILFIFIVSLLAVFLAPNYGVNKYYSIACFALAILSVFLFTLELVFCIKLYKVAREYDNKDSKVELEEDNK